MTISVEEFLLARSQALSPAARTPDRHTGNSVLPEEAQQAAKRGWLIFPVPKLAKSTGCLDLLLKEASCEPSRLEELAAAYGAYDWRVAAGPSSLCILIVDGRQGQYSLSALSQDEGECLTLQARRENAAWAFFRWPPNLVLRPGKKELAAGIRIIAQEESCPIVPFCNPWAEVEAIPYWLRDLAFENPNTPRGQASFLPPFPHTPVPCRSRAQFAIPQRCARQSYRASQQAGWNTGFRISRRR